MLNENQVKRELELAKYLYNLTGHTTTVSQRYWQAGYKVALEVVLELTKSNQENNIRKSTDFDKLLLLLGTAKKTESEE